MWPIMSEKDNELINPFPPLAKTQLQKPVFVYFDIGSVLIDLHWEDFFGAVDKLLGKSHKTHAKAAMASPQMKEGMHLWCTGKMGPFDFSRTFASCLGYANAPESLLAGDTNVPSPLDIKEASSRIVGPVRARSLRLAKELRAMGVGIGVLSNAVPWHETDIEATLRLRDVFDVVVFSQDVGFEKPSPEIYTIAHNLADRFVQRRGITPMDFSSDFSDLADEKAKKCLSKTCKHLEKSQVYFVDDTPANVRAAMDFGWNAALVCLLKEALFADFVENRLPPDELSLVSTQCQNLLFGDEAARRVENLFKNLLASLEGRISGVAK